MEAALTHVKDEIRQLYLEDDIPWVIGYSGGKDSTAVVQLTWLALRELSPSEREKPVHVISTDTLVENPVVAAWVNRSLEVMRQAAEDERLPIIPHRLTPAVRDSFWVNLIGKGYPAPRNKFRWCTERLKIKPSNTFIMDVVKENGEAILLLGMRRAESAKRSQSMEKHSRHSVRSRLAPNANLPNSLVYTPIEDWSDDDVWQFLLQVKNPWGYSNHDLMSMYRGASEDNECPLVVDTSTPSCGNSRFGCFVCTLVDQDKSMAAMIQNDSEKEWMLPLLELRNELDFRGEDRRLAERERRDFRRIDGRLTLFNPKDRRGNPIGDSYLVHGPYTQEVRAHWLRRVLEVQQIVRELAPNTVGEIELITHDEMQEIRRIWVVEKHEIEDLLPQVYAEVAGQSYPGDPIDEDLIYTADTLRILQEESEAEDGELVYELTRNLLDIERRYRTMVNRRGLFDELEKAVRSCFYLNEEDALGRARALHEQSDQPSSDVIVSDEPEEVVTPASIESTP